MRVLVLDNYDSFTYNLVQYLGELGAELEVVRNDHASVDELLIRGYDRVIVSCGRGVKRRPRRSRSTARRRSSSTMGGRSSAGCGRRSRLGATTRWSPIRN